MHAGKPEQIRLKLRCCGQRIEAGQRIRLVIATTHWPIVFPAPERPRVTIHCVGTRLTLPGHAPQPLDAGLAAFGPPETSTPLARVQLVPAKPFRRQITTDQITGRVTTVMEEDTGLARQGGSVMCLSGWHQDSFSVHPDDPGHG